MAVAMIGPKFYAWDRNGKPLAFGKLFTYQARTNTPKATYQSEDQVVENTNPVILNGEGYANVYLDGSYKMVLKDDKDNEIWSSDPVTSAQATEWVNCYTASYLSPSSFSISGNVTSIYSNGRKVRLDSNQPEYDYATVISSSYASGITTVNVNLPVVNTGLISSCTSITSNNSSVDTSLYSSLVFETVSKLQSGITIGDIEIKLNEGMFVSIVERGYENIFEVKAEPSNGMNKIDLGDGLSAVLYANEGDILNPVAYGAKFDDIQDIGPYINAMLSDLIVPSIPSNQCLIDTQIDILDYSCIVFNGSRIRTTQSVINMFSAISVDNWSLIGSAEIKGSAPGASSNQVGLKCEGCLSYRVENIVGLKFLGHSFLISTDGEITTRGLHGQWNNCLALESRVGWEFEDGTSAEYTVLTGCSALFCTTGVKNGAGNTNWNGGNIVDNTIGIELYGGSNDNHGIFSGVNINHNLQQNLLCNDVGNGYTFDGCHFYANGAIGSETGYIFITNSKQININGGTLACPVRIDKGDDTKTGTVLIKDAYVNVESWFEITGTAIDDHLVCKGLYGDSGLLNQYVYPRPKRVDGTVGFQNGWSDFGSGRGPLSYQKTEDNVVRINGVIDGGTTTFATVVASLGSDYAPDLVREFIVKEGANPTFNPAYIQINASGDILWLGGGNTQVAIDISYPIIG